MVLQRGKVLVAILGVWVLGTLLARQDWRANRSVNVEVGAETRNVRVGPTTCIRYEESHRLVGMQVPPLLAQAKAPSQRHWVKVTAVRDGWWTTAYITEGKVDKGEFVVVMYESDGQQQRIPQSECLVSKFRSGAPRFASQ